MVRRKALAAFLLGEQLLCEKFLGASSENETTFYNQGNHKLWQPFLPNLWNHKLNQFRKKEIDFVIFCRGVLRL